MPNTGQTTEYIRVQSSGWPSGPMRGRATPVYVAVSSGQRALRATVIKSSNHEGVPAIGGAAAAAAEHARTSEEQRKGHRASLVLRTKVNKGDGLTSTERHDTEVDWLLYTMGLSETQGGFRGMTFRRTAASEAADAKDWRAKSQELVEGVEKLKDVKLPTDGQAFMGSWHHMVATMKSAGSGGGHLNGTVTEIARVVGVDGLVVKEGVQALFDNAPLIGVVFAGLSFLKCSVQMVFAVVDRVSLAQLQASSYSVVEGEVVTSLKHFKNLDLAELGKGIAESLVKGVSSAFGVSVLTGPILTFLNIAGKIAYRVYQYCRMRDFNSYLETGTVTRSQLANYPAIGLYLPFLPAIDMPSWLGVLPPGMAYARPTDAKVVKFKALLRSSDDDVLALRVGLSVPGYWTSDASVDNPWRPDMERYVKVLYKTNAAIHNLDIRLYRTGGTTLFYDAPPTTLGQRVNAKVDEMKTRFLALFQ